ncbi:DUF1566 domain-containing protein [bacterium]|nr:DUF1566 domain-containing protein [bacterium]
MKKFSVVFALFAALVFVVSCGDGSSQKPEGGESEKTAGELGGECYPNKTCNEGLSCDEESNLCVEDSENPTDPTEEPTDEPTNPTESTDPTTEPTDPTDNPTDEPTNPTTEPTPDEDADTSEPEPDEDADSTLVSDEDADNPEPNDEDTDTTPVSDEDTDTPEPNDEDSDTTPIPDEDTDTTPVSDEDTDTPEPNDEDSVTPPIPDEDADTIPALTEEGLYFGIIGFNQELYIEDIDLLDSSSESSYKSFIDALTSGNGTGLYFADYTALGMMRDYSEPPNLKNVALVTFTDGLDNISLANDDYNPENYGSQAAYRNALHDMIVDEDGIHGKKIEAYTIGLKGNDVTDTAMFEETLKKLSSSDSNVFNVADMDEAKEHFREIAEGLYSISKTVNLDVLVPGGYDDGQLLRFTFDNKTATASSLYIEATYRRISGRTLENITYHGLASLTTVATGTSAGAYHHFVFEELKYADSDTPISDADINKIMLWKETSTGGWDKESEFDPASSVDLEENKNSALIMLVLDCTTSLGSDFSRMKQAAKDFVTTLVNGGTETQVSECTGLPANAQWNTASEITQTWNGTSWTPTTTGAYSETASTEKCYFKCASGYSWNGSQCVIPSNPCSPNPCSSISNSTGVCTVSGSSYVCGCNSGYDWTGSLCQSGSSGGSKSLGEICTGQTSCYNASSSMTCPSSSSADFFGQDAQYTSKCTAQSFSSSTNVVIDNNTGLTWEKSPSSSTYTWTNRATHCNELNSSNYAGINNWRVPNPLELMTIVDNSRYNPATNSNFTNMPTDSSVWIWTSAEYKGNTSYAYAFKPYYGYYYGYNDSSYSKTKTYKVLCVSGDEMQPAISADFTSQTISGKVVVTDSKTSLMWQKTYESSKTWQQALKYCEDSTYAGYSDWRLPNKNELSSLINYEKSGAPYSYFPDMPSSWFWSSSTDVTSTNGAWGVNFDIGYVSNYYKSINYYVRCVR